MNCYFTKATKATKTTMTEKIYLGVNDDNQCCIIYTNGIVSRMDSTNWGGHDDFDRTMALYRFKTVGNFISYNGCYSGVDYDMGHEYSFNFKFNRIIEVIAT